MQIAKPDGTPVDERPVAQAALADTDDEHSLEFEGLPLGEYLVNVWANLEGNDGTGVPTAQGMRGQNGVTIYVGNTGNVQAVQQMPVGGRCAIRRGGCGVCGRPDRRARTGHAGRQAWDGPFRAGLQKAAEALMQIDSLAGGFQAELTRISNQLNFQINWDPERTDGTVSAIQQRLQGMQSIDAASNPGDLAVAIIQVVGDLYG